MYTPHRAGDMITEHYVTYYTAATTPTFFVLPMFHIKNRTKTPTKCRKTYTHRSLHVTRTQRISVEKRSQWERSSHQKLICSQKQNLNFSRMENNKDH
jgi:hypothetical protein